MVIWQVNERLCVVYLLTMDSLVLWASMSLPENRYNLLWNLKPDILFISNSLMNEILPSLNASQTLHRVYWGDFHDKIRERKDLLFQKVLLTGKIKSDDLESGSADVITCIVDCVTSESLVIYHLSQLAVV